MLGDLIGVIALQRRASLFANEVEGHVLALGLQTLRLCLRLFDDVRVETAAQTLVRVDDNQQVLLIRTCSGEQFGRAIAANFTGE